MNQLTFRWAGWAVLAVAILGELYQAADFVFGFQAYKATALVRFSRVEQTQMAQRALVFHRPSFVRSAEVLLPACASLGLAEKWSQKYNAGERLKDREILELMAGQLSVAPVRGDETAVRIVFYSDIPEEAVALVNAIADSLKIQLAHREKAMSPEQDIQIEPAVRAIRVHPWIFPLIWVVAFALVGMAGVLMIQFGRWLPPPLPPTDSPEPEVRIISQY